MRRDNHMDTTRPGQPTGNRTLDALPTEVRQRILAQLIEEEEFFPDAEVVP